MTRGERNHNPLNIRRNDRNRWLGQTAWQYDREFVQFQSDLFGFRAAFRILRTYLRQQGLSTLRQVIYRWAPPEDGNNTRSYVETVARRSGVSPDTLLRFEDEEKMLAIVSAMAWVESAMDKVPADLLRQAYLLVEPRPRCNPSE